jgi:hypothetical protein
MQQQLAIGHHHQLLSVSRLVHLPDLGLRRLRRTLDGLLALT